MLRPADFAVPKHELIFAAIAELRQQGAPTDVIAVTDELIKTGELQRAGGADYVHMVTSVVPSADSAVTTPGIVKDAATARGLVEIGHRLQAGGGEPGVRLASALTELQELRDQAAAGADDAHVRWLRDVLDVPRRMTRTTGSSPGCLSGRTG